MGLRDARSASARSQSELIGLVIVIGMALASATIIVAFGGTALDDTQHQAEIERAEHWMTLFDARASLAALGDSPSQSVSLGQSRGTFTSAPDSGWMRITHGNYTNNNDNETFFNESLGAVVYENRKKKVAYQGGGVWRQSGQSAAQMVSPPEFHYRGATLTLPIIRVETAGTVSGRTTIDIQRVEETRRVFPNKTSSTPTTDEVGAPYNGTDRQYVNPVNNGTVTVTVDSEYYRGWAEYFRTRTEGIVSVEDANNQAHVTLESLAGSIGLFEMPLEGNALGVQGIGQDHPISNFNITLEPDPHFQNMHWSFYVEESTEEFELHFYSDGKCTGSGSGTYSGDLDVSIYYSNDTADIHEEWQNTSINEPDNPDFNVNCDSENLTVDLMSSTTMTYDDIEWTGNDNRWYFRPEISGQDVATTTTSFGSHTADTGNFTQGEEAELGFLMNHYLSFLGPEFDLTVTDGPGGSSRVDESASTGYLTYDTSTIGRFVTFMHITENRLNVTFD
jgi:hypothetical protein